MGAIDPGAWTDQLIPLSYALGKDWQDMAQSVQMAETDDQCVALIESFLISRQPAAAASFQSADLPCQSTCARGLTDRADTKGVGRSRRQAARRIKAWSGLTLRDLRSIGKAEAVFFRSCSAMAQGRVDYAGLAYEGGYADQAHLSRAVKRACGFSPSEFLRRMPHDDAFCIYRVWRQFFDGTKASIAQPAHSWRMSLLHPLVESVLRPSGHAARKR